MSSDLFRREAIDAMTERDISGATLVVPVGLRAYAAFILALAASVVGLLVFGHYTPKDTVKGYLTTTEANVQVFSQSSGTVVDVLVRDGETVSKGQALMRLSTSRVAQQSEDVRQSIIDAMRKEQAALLEEIQSIRDASNIRMEGYKSEVSSSTNRVALLEQQRATLASSAEIAKRDIARLEEMQSSSYVSESDLDAARGRYAEFEVRLGAIELDIDAAKMSLSKAETALAETPLITATRLAEKQSEYQRLSVRISEGLAASEQTVVAPSDGIVSGLLVRSGQTVASTTPLLSLVPRSATYYAELLIPTKTVGFIREGADVTIRYDAYPYQKFGTYTGEVEYVSRTTTLPSDKPFPMPVAESVYLARVAVFEQSITGADRQLPLQAGMTLAADVQRDSRRILDWVFDPLVRARQRL